MGITREYKNFSLNKSVITNDNETFNCCNFTQDIPGTEIFKGAKRLTFIRCNLVNVKLPYGTMIEPTEKELKDRKDEWVIYGGNIVQIDRSDKENNILLSQKNIATKLETN